MNIKEYQYANKLYTYTIAFVLAAAALNAARMLSNLIGNDDYVFSICFSMIEFLIPLLVYLYMARDRLVAYPKLSFGKEVKLRLRFNMPKPLTLLLSVMSGAAILPLLYLINAISVLLVRDVTTNRVQEAADRHSIGVLMVTVALLPALLEECIYRGVLFGVYSRAGALKGALLSSFLFALMHSNLNQFCYAFIAGFAFAMLSWASGSVICSFIVHMLINGSSVMRLYHPEFYYPKWMTAEVGSIGEVLKAGLLPALVGLVISGTLFWLVLKLRKKDENILESLKGDKKAGEGMIDRVLVIGMVIMLVNMVAAEFVK